MNVYKSSLHITSYQKLVEEKGDANSQHPLSLYMTSCDDM